MKFFRDFYGDYQDDPLRHLRFSTTVRTLLPERDLLDVLGPAFVAVHERAAGLAGKARWADKAPENVLYLREWERILGDQWLFVHVVRNPLDTLASIKEARFPLTIPPDPEGRIALYRRYTEDGLEFAKAHPERAYLLVYERLVGAPEKVVSDLMSWLGEAFHPSQLAFNELEHGRGLEDPKVAGTAWVHSSSVHRWPTVLGDEEAAVAWARTSDLWRLIDPEARYALPGPSATGAAGRPV